MLLMKAKPPGSATRASRSSAPSTPTTSFATTSGRRSASSGHRRRHEALRFDQRGRRICEAVSAELLQFGPHCSQAALERHLRDQKRQSAKCARYWTA
jgi:hypothetical protein